MSPKNVEPMAAANADVDIKARQVEDGRIRLTVKPARRELRWAKTQVVCRMALAGYLLGAFMYGRTAFPTSIVVIRTSDRVVMAADSKGTFVGEGGITAEQVCKIYRSGTSFFAVAGFANDPVTRFNLSATVVEASKGQEGIAAKIEATVSAVKPLLDREAVLLRYRRNEYEHLTDPQNGGATVVFISVNQGVPVAEGVQFSPHISKANVVRFTIRLDACPGNCPNGVKVFWAGAHRAIEQFIASSQEHRSLPPEDLARDFVHLEVLDDSANVGTPIDSVSMTADGSYRIDSEHNCPK